jgi:hypothetical protein
MLHASFEGVYMLETVANGMQKPKSPGKPLKKPLQPFVPYVVGFFLPACPG